jgi:hypothetical protein
MDDNDIRQFNLDNAGFVDHQPHHDDGAHIDDLEPFHRADLYDAATTIVNDGADVTLEHVRAVHRAAAIVLDDYDPGYTIDLGPVNQLATPLNPATIRVNIDGTTYRLTAADTARNG